MFTLFLIVLSSMFFTGIIGRTRSILSGRKGPGILQPLRNLQVLLKKGSVYSTTSSFITQVAPIISLAAMVTAAFLIPFVNTKAVLTFNYDFILFAYLIAVSRFFLILAALDSGSSFEGMGSAREALYALLLEPAFFVIFGSLALLTGNTSFEDIFSSLSHFSFEYVLITVLTIYVFFNIALIENSRLPVDDPKTHLELTMIHEVMVLDYSGVDLAFIHIVSFIKFSVFGLLISNCLIPLAWPIYYQVLLFVAIQIVFAAAIGVVESFRARNRMNKNATYVLSISAIALLTFLLSLLLTK